MSLSFSFFYIKGPLLGQSQFLATESPLRMMKNSFYFTLEAFFVLKMFNFVLDFFDHVGKRVNKANFKIYDVIY